MIESVKTYIKSNKYLKWSLVGLTLIAVVLMMAQAISEKKSSEVKAFLVTIEYQDKAKRLIHADYIRNYVREHLGYKVDRTDIDDLDLLQIEKILKNNSYIDSVQVYIDGRNVVRAWVKQKNPMVRIEAKESAFYLDSKGDRMPLSSVAAVRVPVVTGNIEPYDTNYRNIEEHQYQHIFHLITEINKDDFLDALVEQIHIEQNGNFLLIPKIGKEKIILGSVYSLEDKIFNLKQFYKEGLTRQGWGKYAYLDLQYEDQVVATRK